MLHRKKGVEEADLTDKVTLMGMLRSFCYPGRIIMNLNSDWKLFQMNMKKDRSIWASIVQVLA